MNNPSLDPEVALAPFCRKAGQGLVARLVYLSGVVLDDVQQFEGTFIRACNQNGPLPRPAGALGEVRSAKDVSHVKLGCSRSV
jgi:hypothetical protein